MPFKTDSYIYCGPFSLAKIAAASACKIVAPNNADDVEILNLAPLSAAGVGDLSFFDNPKYIEQFLQCKATACIVAEKYASRIPEGVIALVSNEPYQSYAKVAQLFYKSKDDGEGIHPTAVINPTAKIGNGCTIGAYTVIHENVIIGEGTKIASNVTIRAAHIGSNCVIHDGVRIGQEGFGFALSPAGHVKVPQLGGVVIGNFVEIGANTCIDRGSGPNTTIGDGTKIDNLVQIAHNVEIGRNCVIVSQVGIAGSTKIDDFAILGGQVGLSGHIRIGAGARVAAGSGVMRDVAPRGSVGGYPAMNIRDWHKATLMIEKLTKGKKDD